MDKIARSPEIDRKELFSRTADAMGQLSPAIIEKDFWVCWVLDALFSSPQWRDKIVFKGGTSLSKAFRIISRFSEDIDLILDWRQLGVTSDEAWDKRSNTSQEKFCKDINSKAATYKVPGFIYKEIGASRNNSCGANVLGKGDNPAQTGKSGQNSTPPITTLL